MAKPDIDNPHELSRYLCPYQSEIVFCEDRYQFTRKANRIGMTWAMALKDVRRRIAEKNRDCLFTTQNWNGALEFGRYLDLWIDIFRYGAAVLSRSEEWRTVMVPDGRGGSIATQEKVGIYTFDTGSRIILFSSSPWAIQTFEGDVRWDECEFHEQQEQMHTALSTRVQFGYDYHAWSARNGVQNWVNQVLYKIATEKGSGWTVREIDIYRAIEDGLVDKINERSGMNMTREEFLADCKRRSLSPAIFASRYECKAVDDNSTIVPWQVIEKAATQSVVRRHVSQEEVLERFGMASDYPTDAAILGRMTKMQAWLRERFAPLFATPGQYRIGYDVAASGNGDLGSFWIAVKKGDRLQQRGLLTTRTEDWHFHEAALFLFMSLPGAKGCGDGTGIGQSVTWKAAARFAGRFEGVRFSRMSKAEMGLRIMNLLTSGHFELMAQGEENKDADVAMDFFSIQKKTEGTGVVFVTSQNPLNNASHGDMFWSAALCAHADATIEGSGGAGFGVGRIASAMSRAVRGFGGLRPAKTPL